MFLLWILSPKPSNTTGHNTFIKQFNCHSNIYVYIIHYMFMQAHIQLCQERPRWDFECIGCGNEYQSERLSMIICYIFIQLLYIVVQVSSHAPAILQGVLRTWAVLIREYEYDILELLFTWIIKYMYIMLAKIVLPLSVGKNIYLKWHMWYGYYSMDICTYLMWYNYQTII